MYVRIVNFILGPDRQWEAERIADVISSITLQQCGCTGFQFFADHETGEYQSTSYWKTKQDWDDSFQVMWPIFVDMIGDHFQWAPKVQMFQVYEPKLISIQQSS